MGLPSETNGALTAYNRWGQEIYQNHQYKTEWPAGPEKFRPKPITLPGVTEVVL